MYMIFVYEGKDPAIAREYEKAKDAIDAKYLEVFRDAAQGDGACSTDGEVGTCDLGDSKLVYYEGDPGGLEIGCGFQGGEWVSP